MPNFFFFEFQKRVVSTFFGNKILSNRVAKNTIWAKNVRHVEKKTFLTCSKQKKTLTIIFLNMRLINASFSSFFKPSRFRKSFRMKPIVLKTRSRAAELGYSVSNVKASCPRCCGIFPIMILYFRKLIFSEN